MNIKSTILLIVLGLSFLLTACDSNSKPESLSKTTDENSITNSSSNDLTQFPLSKRAESLYNISVGEVTPENYPKVGATEYTSDIAKMLFENFFTCGENKSIKSHELYPHEYFSPKELTDKVLNGDIDVAFIEQTDIMNIYDGSLSYTLLGSDALVLLTSRDNPVNTISSENLKKIADGNITDWAELGGTSGRISLLGSHNFNSGNYLFEKCFLNNQGSIRSNLTDAQYSDMFDERNIISAQFNKTTDYVMEFVPFYKLLSQLSFGETNVKDLVKPIYIDGQKPVSQNVLNKDYPYTVKIYAVTKSGLTQDSVTEQIVNAIAESDGSMFKMLSGAGVIDKPMDLSEYLVLD